MKKFIFCLILCNALGLAGCSNGSSSSNPPTPLPSPTPTVTPPIITAKVTNLSDTIFAGVTYSANFSFTNTSNLILNLTSVSASFPSPAIWTESTNTCNGNISLSPNESCNISGSFQLANNLESATISFIFNESNESNIYTYNQNITAVTKAESDYFAMRFVNKNPADKIFLAASQNDSNGKSVMLSFNDTGIGSLTTESSDGPSSWNTYAIDISTIANNTIYIPVDAQGGGKLYLSVNHKLSNGGAPNPTGNDTNNNNIQWQEIEFSYVNNVANPYIDVTNVNLMSIPLALNAIVQPDQVSYTAGTKYSSTIPMSEILAKVKSALSNWPDSWGSLSNYNGTSSELLRIISAVSLPTNLPDFATQDFNTYIDDLWSYYTNHYIYIDATEIAALAGSTTTCILQGQISNESMSFTIATGYGTNDCKENSVTGTLTQTFTKFTPGDFLLGAPGSAYTLWGQNQTYRSIIGRDIAAAQSVGFLPFCSNPDFIYGNAQFVANKNSYYQAQYTCLSNYNSYTDNVINQYAHENAKYFTYYGYPYSDVLGEDNTLNLVNPQLDPVTIYILKLK